MVLMTCNQVIVLMDCRRGFNASRHNGTLSEDLRQLQAWGLVEPGRPGCFDWELTIKGDQAARVITAAAASVAVSV